tara:strand:+ start:462 stop:605 length:144 start_codon:yes stop_codon:yes gene_type:complete
MEYSSLSPGSKGIFDAKDNLQVENRMQNAGRTRKNRGIEGFIDLKKL